MLPGQNCDGQRANEIVGHSHARNVPIHGIKSSARRGLNETNSRKDQNLRALRCSFFSSSPVIVPQGVFPDCGGILAIHRCSPHPSKKQ